MPQRIQLHRTPGWRMPAGTVKVDRTTRFGNPFTAADHHTGRQAYMLTRHGMHWLPGVDWTRADVVRMHAEWLEGQIPRDADGRALPVPPKLLPLPPDLEALRGRDLACWCRLGLPCHADTLLRLANATASVHEPRVSPQGTTPPSQLD